MMKEFLFMKLFLMLFLFTESVFGQKEPNRNEADGSDGGGIMSVEYSAGFSESVSKCSDAPNKFEMEGMKVASDETGTAAGLSGCIEVQVDVDEGYELEVIIFKETEMGDELMYSCRLDFCAAIAEQDAPWAALTQAANMTACPVKMATYNVAFVLLDLSPLKDVLTSQHVGPYIIFVKVIDTNGVDISCNILNIEIYEKKKEDEDERK